MLPSNIWQRQWFELVAGRRRLLLAALVPLALALPVLGSSVPKFHQAALLTTLIALTGAFRAGARVVVLRDSGVLDRLYTSPASPYRLFTGQVLLQLAVNFLVLFPLLLCLAARYQPSPGGFGLLVFESVPALVLAGLVGVLAASLSATPAEVPLYSLVMLLPALYVAGVYSPDPSFEAARVALLPFGHLHQALRLVLGGTAAWPVGRLLLGGPASALAWLAVALLMLRRRLQSAQ